MKEGSKSKDGEGGRNPRRAGGDLAAKPDKPSKPAVVRRFAAVRALYLLLRVSVLCFLSILLNFLVFVIFWLLSLLVLIFLLGSGNEESQTLNTNSDRWNSYHVLCF